MTAHLCGKGVRGIHHVRDAVVGHVLHQPPHTAKAADAHGQGLRQRGLRDARVRENCRHAGLVQCPGQLAGAGGTAQQENMRHD